MKQEMSELCVRCGEIVPEGCCTCGPNQELTSISGDLGDGEVIKTYDELRTELLCQAGTAPAVRAIIMLLDALEAIFQEDFDPMKALGSLEYWVTTSKRFLEGREEAA